MIKQRLIGLAWHTGMMMLAAGIDYVVGNISGLGFSGTTTVVLGLILGQISKAVHDYILETQ